MPSAYAGPKINCKWKGTRTSCWWPCCFLPWTQPPGCPWAAAGLPSCHGAATLSARGSSRSRRSTSVPRPGLSKTKARQPAHSFNPARRNTAKEEDGRKGVGRETFWKRPGVSRTESEWVGITTSVRSANILRGQIRHRNEAWQLPVKRSVLPSSLSRSSVQPPVREQPLEKPVFCSNKKSISESLGGQCCPSLTHTTRPCSRARSASIPSPK
eukprot:3936748-Rhodomonas_salina.4